MTRKRLRDFGISIGTLPTGRFNGITDVAGVRVGHATIIHDEPRIARTGVTVIVPDAVAAHNRCHFAGYHSFNGCGEMTGLLWVQEVGVISSPIGLTNTHQVGLVRDTLIKDAVQNHGMIDSFRLPVVTETYDGWLNEIEAFHLTEQHVFEALRHAAGGPVAEGNVGGGTGMICHEFKGGIGTSSRVVKTAGESFTVGVLVQANYGKRRQLRIGGVAVGENIGYDKVPAPWPVPPKLGSIIVIVATDAPALPHQCRRLAQRATVGLARTGGVGYNSSGDIFFAFSTANAHPIDAEKKLELESLRDSHLDPLFDAVADATEESILNALCAAKTMTGQSGRTAHALPIELSRSLVIMI